MKTASKKMIRVSTKQKILIGIASIIVILCSWWAAVNFMPHPLGDKMTYLGKEDYGNWLGFDYRPSSVYYYGTDMDAEETVNYFSKASRPDKSDGTETWRKLFALKAPNGETVYFYFYTREAFMGKNPDSPFKITSNYVISIPGSKYDAAKDSL